MSDAIRITERERSLRSARPLHPQREIWNLLRDQSDVRRADREAARRRLADERVPLAELVVAIVNLQHQFTAFARANGTALTEAGLEQQAGVLEGLADKLAQAVRQAGARVLAPDGQVWAAEDAAWAEIVAAQTDPAVEEPVIRETVVPGVWLRGELLQRAAVVVAAPPPQAASENREPERNAP